MLNRREYFVIAIAQSLLGREGMGFSQALDQAIKSADELIQKLKPGQEAIDRHEYKGLAVDEMRDMGAGFDSLFLTQGDE